jgi:transposase
MLFAWCCWRLEKHSKPLFKAIIYKRTEGTFLVQYVVERTFGWLRWSRRLSRDYERLPASAETWIYARFYSTDAEASSVII